MKDNIADNPAAPIKRTYDETISDLRRVPNALNQEDIPVFEEIAQTLKRKKRQNVPPIPQTEADVLIQGEWSETWDGQRYLMHQNNNWGIAIFATQAER